MNRGALRGLSRQEFLELNPSAPSVVRTVNGAVTFTGAVTVPAGTVTLAEMANLAANTIIGNNNVLGVPLALTRAQVLAMLSGQATSAFDWGAQNLSNIGTLTNADTISLINAKAFGTVTADTTMGTIGASSTLTTGTNTNLTIKALSLTPSITLAVATGLGAALGISLGATVQTNANQVSTLWTGFSDTTTIRSATGTAGILQANVIGCSIAQTIQTQDTNAQTLGTWRGFSSTVALTVASSGSLTVSELSQYHCPGVIVPTGATVTAFNALNVIGPTFTGTVTTYTGVKIGSPAGGGTLTTWIGVDIPAGAGTTKIGLRNAAQTQLGSSAQCTVDTSGNISTSGTLSVTGHATLEGVTSTGATGTGKLVFDGTPTLVTPNIGAATGTSLACSGVVTGTNTWDSCTQVTTSDATTTGQSLVDITGLTAALVSGTYEFEAVLRVSTSNDTAGTEYGLSVTANLSSLQAQLTSSTAASTFTTVKINANNTATAAFLTSANQISSAVIKGFVIMTGSGTFSVQHLKVTSGTSTVTKGSTLKVRKVA